MYLNLFSNEKGVLVGVSREPQPRCPDYDRKNYYLATNDLREAQSVLAEVRRALWEMGTPTSNGFWAVSPRGATFKVLDVLKASGLYKKASK